MRIIVASDIHGSSFWTEKLIDKINDENPDFVLLLGDILYHGPRNSLPKEYDSAKCSKLLNSIKNKIFCVRGNCDANVDQYMLEFPIMAEYAVFMIGNHKLYATHGDKFNKENPPLLSPGDALLNGHFHVSEISLFNNGRNIYINPGSVSIPKAGSGHTFAVIDDNNVSIVSLENGNVIYTNDTFLK